MHRNHHASGKWTDILPLTHECTKIIIPQANTPRSYTSHMNAPKFSLLKYMHRYPTPYTWIHQNHHLSGKCNGILPLTHECTANCHSTGKCTNIPPLTHECTDIIIPQVNAQESYPSHMNAPKSSFLMWLHRYPTPHTWMHRHHHPSSKCTRIMNVPPIVTPQVNAPISYPSHMNAPKSALLR